MTGEKAISITLREGEKSGLHTIMKTYESCCLLVGGRSWEAEKVFGEIRTILDASRQSHFKLARKGGEGIERETRNGRGQCGKKKENYVCTRYSVLEGAGGKRIQSWKDRVRCSGKNREDLSRYLGMSEIIRKEGESLARSS